MPEFRFQKMFPLGPDTTPYRKLDADLVSVGRYRDRDVLEVDPAALTRLAAEAIRDV